eukprot:CAMPEP_0119556492 /NCGR_PEP_ID=MMETSP1352-20130426/8424_1 /TAXON_ID=265584 /ORGANISM="Stauroneis constricta, Strain CCMP1120" /LENGTH=413 /DNA_ID=CAMNT_0007603455 /DNA_START=244 /DNA_END=1485 /DNA_ORIENTATION=+
MPAAEQRIGEYSVSHLLKTAKEVVERKTADSIVLDETAERRIPKFEFNELTLGRVLGRGGFCVVNEVTGITLHTNNDSNNNNNNNNPASNNTNNNDDDEHYIHNIVQDRSFMSDHCIRQGKDCRYAIKIIQDKSRRDPNVFVNAIVDLAIEAKFLAVIRHPNIIKMRAMDVSDPCSTDKFFVVLDRLYDIMPTRLSKWKKRQPGKLWKKLTDPRGKRATAFWVERLTVAYDIACALKFLHDMNVIYRDLKPDNIGFDVRGDVKLFDFGLAKELDPKQRLDDGTFKLTADTGSTRYMAPEVAKGKNYNETADSFSFAILFWQLATLKTPYEGYTVSMFEKKVIHGGHRPAVNINTVNKSANIMKLLQDCFVKEGTQRPSMEDHCEILRSEINALSDEEIEEMVDESRKSMLSAS